MELRADVVDVSGVKKRLTVEVPAEVTAREVEKVAGEYQRQAVLPGFRRGKAPLNLIKRRYASQIREEVLSELVPQSLRQVVRERSLRTLGEPRLEAVKMEPGQSLTYEAVVEVYPEVPLPEYRGLKVEVPAPEVPEAAVEERLEKLRAEHAQLVPVEDRPVAAGDSVLVDLVGEFVAEEGKAVPEPIVQEDVTVEVGAEDTFPAFTEALLDANIGEERTFEVDYPADYQSAKLAGRRVRFRVEVTDIRRKELPELNDDFARDLGEFESLEEVRRRIRGDLEHAAKLARDNEIREAVKRKLIEGVEFDVPESLVRSALRSHLERVAQSLAQQGIDPGRARVNWEKISAELRPQAEAEVRVNLVLDRISEAENLVVTDEDLEGEISSMAAASQESPERTAALFRDQGMREALRHQLRRRRALQLVIDAATVV
ncbi:MAG: trigger factor [Acidobacteriota bacterium]